MESPVKFASSRLEINLLGGFTVYIDNEILPGPEIKGRKARALLKLVAHQRHCQMVREQAIDMLWPELDVTAASSQLYKAIHHIRKGFSTLIEEAADWIEITDDLIRLNPPGAVTTDAQRFEQAARAGLQARDIPGLELAVSIYSGDFLPMEQYTDWATFPREHYRQLYLDVLIVLAVEYEKRGDLIEAAEMLRLALEKEPTLETAHRNLMRIFARKGQATRAYHQYEICREILGEELGMSPSAETKETLDGVSDGRFIEKEDHVALSGAAPTPVSPIFGRFKECALIERLLERLASGNGDVLTISGEMGTGKTRLIQELILRCRRIGISFFIGRAGESAGPAAYEPFVELLRAALHKHPELEEALPVEIRRLIPGCSDHGAPAPHADKLAAKGYLFAQIHRFFEALTANEPAVIVLENFHAADQGSHELLFYLIRHRENMPVLFTTTHRKEKGADLLWATGVPEPSPESIELGPLSFEEHANLLHHHAAKSGISLDTTDQIYRLSEGNPLFGIELLHLIGHNGYAPDRTGDDSRLSFPALRGKMPPSIGYMAEQMTKELSSPACQLLYIAAVIGRTAPYELIASVWSGGKDSEEEVLFDALEEVIRARLLEESGLDYSFRHALIREAIYASISEARRRILHQLTADRLTSLSEGTDEDPVEQIAFHFIHGGEKLRGAQYLVRAGEKAENAYAHEDALQRYAEACNALDDLGDDQAKTLKYKTKERIGDVYRACGRLEKSYDAYLAAIDLAEETPANQRDLVELHRKMAVAAILRTDMERSEKHLEKAFDLVEENDARAKARLLITRALHLWHCNMLDEAYVLAQKALKHAEAVHAHVESSQACEILAMTCLPLGRWQEGLEYEKQRKTYGWSPEVVVATDAHLCLWEYHVSGDQPLQQARSFLETVAGQAAEIGDLRCVAVCHYALGTMYLWRGQRRQAVNELASSLDLHEQVGSPAGMAYALARKSALHTLMGATDLGWKAFTDGLTHAREASVRDHCLQRLYGVGLWNRMEAGDREGARELAEKSKTLLDESGACAACALELYPWLAYFYLRTGEIELTRECGKVASELAAKTGNPVGKAIAAIIESSLCLLEQDEPRSKERCRESFKIMEEAVSETTHSPVAHYLERMVEQQEELRQV